MLFNPSDYPNGVVEKDEVTYLGNGHIVLKKIEIPQFSQYTEAEIETTLAGIGLPRLGRVGRYYLFTGPNFVGSARIGYRYEGNKGVQFRIGFSPIYGKFAETELEEYSGKGVLPWGYISAGYAF